MFFWEGSARDTVKLLVRVSTPVATRTVIWSEPMGPQF